MAANPFAPTTPGYPTDCLHGGTVLHTLALQLTSATCLLRGICEWRPSPCRELEPSTDALLQGSRKMPGLAA